MDHKVSVPAPSRCASVLSVGLLRFSPHYWRNSFPKPAALSQRFFCSMLLLFCSALSKHTLPCRQVFFVADHHHHPAAIISIIAHTNTITVHIITLFASIHTEINFNRPRSDPDLVLPGPRPSSATRTNDRAADHRMMTTNEREGVRDIKLIRRRERKKKRHSHQSILLPIATSSRCLRSHSGIALLLRR